MSKYRIKVVHNGYVVQEKIWVFFIPQWVDVSKKYSEREGAEKAIDQRIERDNFQIKYIKYP